MQEWAGILISLESSFSLIKDFDRSLSLSLLNFLLTKFEFVCFNWTPVSGVFTSSCPQVLSANEERSHLVAIPESFGCPATGGVKAENCLNS